tara:strand:+ start:6878 stop:7174 length:297 start_codon:yes stop_codon:yes gene_type:complete
MEELRLIANPYHLKCQKEDDNYINDIKEVKVKPTLDEYLNHKYKDIYLSDLNRKEITIIIDNYINELIHLRTINDIINSIIEKVIENSDKFDFCLPFD